MIMFRVFKSKVVAGRDIEWLNVGEFTTFNDAHKFATETICTDVCHEGSRAGVYYVSDNDNFQEAYKYAIDAELHFT